MFKRDAFPIHLVGITLTEVAAGSRDSLKFSWYSVGTLAVRNTILGHIDGWRIFITFAFLGLRFRYTNPPVPQGVLISIVAAGSGLSSAVQVQVTVLGEIANLAVMMGDHHGN